MISLLIVLATWTVIALPLVLVMDRVEARGE